MNETNILDENRLQNVRRLSDGSIKCGCPACIASGSDSTKDHLQIQPDGKFGCAVHQTREHRREIFRLAGTVKTGREVFSGHRANGNGSPAFDWHKCLDAFTEADAQRLAKWRGLSPAFVHWLHRQGIIGICDGNFAFANQANGGDVVSCHVRLESGNWIFKPKGFSTAPLVFGDVKTAQFILAFESQWDCFSVADRLGLHTAKGLPDTAFFCSRGAGNGKLIRGHVSPDAKVFAFTQNDPPAQRWLADVVGDAGCKVLNVATPGPHKDANDWTRAGATADDLQAAMRVAKAVQSAGIKNVSEPDGDGFDKITSDLRGDILEILMDKNATPAAQLREVCEKVIAALHRAGKFYYHADTHDFETALFFNRFTKRLERIRADSFLSWLADWTRTNRADRIFKFIISAVETESLNEVRSTAIIPESFWASRPGAIYISNGDAALVKITSDGVSIADNGTDSILFYAGKTCAPWQLGTPRDIFETASIFREVHAAAGHGPDLLRSWIYSLPTNPKCKPPLLLVGEIGAGKTALAKSVSQFYGFAPSISKVEEMTESNFWPCINDGGIYTLDNADSKTSWLADTISAASTDGSTRRRKLYKDSETVILKPRAWLILTSANPTFGADSGMADRLLICRMERKESESSDSGLADEITLHRDAGLSHLAVTLQKTLADTGPTPRNLNVRHPDFASFAVRIGRALDREAQMIQAMQTAESDKSTFCLENDATATALLSFLANGETFTGTAGDLCAKLIESDKDIAALAENRKFSSRGLGKKLSALMPHLKKILATARQETGRGRTVFYTFKIRPCGECGEFKMTL